MSVQTTNAISNVVLSTALESGALAWAAHAISSPIGVMGGAIFGAVRYISQLPLDFISNKCFNHKHPEASAAAKTIAKALIFFGSYAAAWGVLAVAGFSLSASHIVSLSLCSIITAIGIDILLECLGISTSPQRA